MMHIAGCVYFSWSALSLCLLPVNWRQYACELQKILLQCDAVRCNALQCVAVHRSAL